MIEKVTVDEGELQARLTPEQFAVTRRELEMEVGMAGHQAQQLCADEARCSDDPDRGHARNLTT